MTHAALAFNSVNFSYGDVPTLENVSFDVPPLQFTGIIGPNGGGKTTLIKLALGLLAPKSGSISIMGHPQNVSHAAAGYVPQTLVFDKLFPLSLLELVLMGRLSHLPWYGKFLPEDKKLALDVLETVGLSAKAQASVGSLSGGELQRALIARALVSKPQILFLDEPTAHVDKNAQEEIHRILRELSKKITVLLVTHDLHTAVQMVDKILVVQKTVKAMKAAEVCEHFAMGLYHIPLTEHICGGDCQ